MSKISVLFVCLGNICRSPAAEGVFRKKAAAANLLDSLEIDSAGTAAWHVGKSPDSRMTAAAKKRGYELSALRARQVEAEDFDNYDYIFAMDLENYDNLLDLTEERDKPTSRAALSLYLDYATHFKEQEVPDPYYGGPEGFDHVLDLVEDAADGFIAEIQDNLSKRKQSAG